jgi:hypothetical protein
VLNEGVVSEILAVMQRFAPKAHVTSRFDPADVSALRGAEFRFASGLSASQDGK